MKIALALGMSPQEAQFARQLGLRYVVSNLPANPTGYLALDDLLRAREFWAKHDLSFDVIENLPTPHYYKAMFGLPGRDEQIEHVARRFATWARRASRYCNINGCCWEGCVPISVQPAEVERTSPALTGR